MKDKIYLEIVERENNVFCKEKCCICGNIFNADDSNIWQCLFGYVCFDCVDDIEKVQKVG